MRDQTHQLSNTFTACRYVTLPQLRSMMAPDSGLSWSPWFRLIAANLLEAWWQNVDETIATDKHVDLKTIHKLTC